MVLLAALPASVTVTNDLAEPLALHHHLQLVPSEATVITLTGRGDGEKTDLWRALANAKAQGHISSATTFETIEDPDEGSGHGTGGWPVHELTSEPVEE